jgi:hypothetical protein
LRVAGAAGAVGFLAAGRTYGLPARRIAFPGGGAASMPAGEIRGDP